MSTLVVVLTAGVAMTDFGSRLEALRTLEHGQAPEAQARAEVADIHTPTADHEKQAHVEKLQELLAKVDPSEVGDVMMVMLLGGLIAGVIGGVGGGLIGGLTNDRRLDNDLDHVYRRVAGLKTADKAFLTEETEMLKAGEITEAEFLGHIQERDGGEFIFNLTALGFGIFASIVGISAAGAGVGGFFASRAVGDAMKDKRRLTARAPQHPSLDQIMEMAENGEDVGELFFSVTMMLYTILGIGALVVGAGGAAVGTAVGAATGAGVQAAQNGRRLEGELSAPMVDGDVDYPW